MKKLHLICNAHLDPVWLWTWEEGAGEVLSTFRVAADFCDRSEGFVFNHNESLLYQWVAEYDPDLYERIKKLVAAGKWHIMGGWYLQPDCNMPSGESFIRQILLGRTFFKEEFSSEPSVAVNFDPFGHSRGLVQILQKSGYKLYIFCRPAEQHLRLPGDDFLWTGYGDSSIRCHRASEHYNSQPGKAAEKIRTYIEEHGDEEIGMVLWGIGNHGGGPSKIDLDMIEGLKASSLVDMNHSTPEAYLSESNGIALPEFHGDLNPWAVGCYSSQARIKRYFRELENTYYSTEKMVSALALQGLSAYPEAELAAALDDILFSMFHDILPGSSIPSAEESSLRRMSHGLEILSRVRAKALFSAAKHEPRPKEGDIPIFIFNPHPYPVSGIFSCEFQRAEQNWEQTFFMPVLAKDGNAIPCQVEKEESNINLDWRKRVVFSATLAPSSLNRFDCSFAVLPFRPEPSFDRDDFVFANEDMSIAIDRRTGLIERYEVGGIPLLLPNSARAMAVPDTDDPWHMDSPFYPREGVPFRLMAREEAGAFSGASRPQDPVRVIEDGAVRTVVESLLVYGNSSLCVRYAIPKSGTRIELSLKVYWNEKKALLKVEFPLAMASPRFSGDDVFGVKTFKGDGQESVCHHWVSADSGTAGFSCANSGVYGVDCKENLIRFSLLRSAAYSAHPINDRPLLREGLFLPRIDQGERDFCFFLNGGAGEARSRAREDALFLNERPFGFSFFPAGTESRVVHTGIVLDSSSVDCTCFKQSDGGFTVRLFEPLGCSQRVLLRVPSLGIESPLEFLPHEIKTLKVQIRPAAIFETELLDP